MHAYENGDPIYLSSEIGLRKSSGRLYQDVGEKENCRPHDSEHIGNNHYSDLYVPSKLGITISPFAELKTLNLLTVLKFSLRSALPQKPQ